MDQPVLPTWKVLLPLAIPMVLLWVTAAVDGKGPIETPVGRTTFGLAFFAVGVWSGFCGVVWQRLSPGFKRRWRPSSVATPWMLAVGFTLVGAWQIVDGLIALSK
jgi:hypothetical protein